MPAQLFQLDGAGRWLELKGETLGDYFASDHLGRALVSLDADRDGRVDLAITHLYEPASLLMNRSTEVGKSVLLELKSTRGQRDAIGAVVTASVGPKKIWKQLFAGDGYMSSNQRRITIGTGAAAEIQNVTVKWPSGEEEHFGTLMSGYDFLLVEGSGQAFQLREHP
jgi:hypothetical protein